MSELASNALFFCVFSFDLLRLLHHYPADVKPNLPLHPRKPGNPALSLQSKDCSEDRRCWGRSKCLDRNRRFLCTDTLGLPDPKGCWSRLPFHSLPLEFSLGTTKRNWYFDWIPNLWFTFWYWNTNHVAGEVALLEFLSILVLSVQSFFPLLQFQQLVPSVKLSFVSDLPHCLKQGKPLWDVLQCFHMNPVQFYSCASAPIPPPALVCMTWSRSQPFLNCQVSAPETSGACVWCAAS